MLSCYTIFCPWGSLPESASHKFWHVPKASLLDSVTFLPYVDTSLAHVVPRQIRLEHIPKKIELVDLLQSIELADLTQGMTTWTVKFCLAKGMK